MKSFKQICPKWYKKVTGKVDDLTLNIQRAPLCVVGEAHGFTSDYMHNASDKYCGICMTYSCGSNYDLEDVKIESTFIDKFDNEDKVWKPRELSSCPTVMGFVKHWNEKHC